MKFLLLVVFGFLPAKNLLFAQDTIPSKTLFFNFSAHYGFIVAHHQNMDYLIKHHVPAGEIDLIRITNGEKQWQKTYKNPEMGLGVFCADLGNPQQLGEAIGVSPFLNFPLNPKRKFKLYFRVGNGIGIVTKPFNRIDNHKNNINGSYLNCFINLRFNSVFYPTKKIRMETGIGLSHLSNGAYALPNLGVNIATINLGISFLKAEGKRQKAEENQNPKSLILNPKYFFTLIAAGGPNQTSPTGGKEYGGYILSASVWKTVSKKSRFGAGIETMYDFSRIEDAKQDSTFDTSKPLNNLQVGIKFGY